MPEEVETEAELARPAVEAVQELEERLAQLLFALANPVRLSLLRQVRQPLGLSEIQVERDVDGRRTVMSRQAVKEHLARLVDAGVVLALEDDRDARRRSRYVINQQQIYGLAEVLRDLSRLQGAADVDQPTMVAAQARNAYDLRPQALVMVKGPHEGRVYPIEPPTEGRREWVIGRNRGLHIPLDHDAYISSENTVISWEQGSYFVADLPHSRNGTRLNFQPLGKGRSERLRTGDLIGVGQTILMFRA